MRNCLGVKCSRKAVHLDESQESVALKLVEKLSAKPYHKYAKVHPDPPPLNPPEFVKEAPQNIDGDYASKSKSVRLVVTKKQLKQMLKNAVALKSMGISVQFADLLAEKGPGSPRWRPALSTIVE